MSLMKVKYILVLLPFLTITGRAESFEEVKEKISCYHSQLNEELPETERGGIHYQLAQAYFCDQETDRAFHHFLSALKMAPRRETVSMGEEEQKLFDEAIGLYEIQVGGDPVKSAEIMIGRYEEIALAHEEYLHLNMLIGVAYANLGKYDLFFEKFYHSYPNLSDTFLAAKTEGILYLRLSQHGTSPEERHSLEEEAFRSLDLALEKNPRDSNLYKVLIFFAKEKNNDQLILTYLQKMVKSDAPIPRGDIYLYVREAVALGKVKLGQEIIDRASTIYEYSRAITAAQEYLNQHKG